MSLLALLLVGLAALALWVWREPLELVRVRQGGSAGLERFLSRYPDSRQGAQTLAESYLREGKPAEAIRLLQARIEQQPENPDWQLLAARAYLAMGDAGRANLHLQVVQRAEPGNAALPKLLSLASALSGEAEKAGQELQALLDRDPEDADLLAGMGELAAGQGRLTEAEKLFTRAAAARPSVPVFARLAEVQFRLGNAAGAAEAARQALKISADHRPSNLWLGRSLYALDPANAAEAEAAFRRALSGPGDPSIPRFHLAQLLREQGQAAEAARLLEENVAANEMDKPSHYELMLCYRSLNRHADAEKVLQRLRTLNQMDLVGSELEYRVWAEPENLAARMKLVRTYLEYQRPDLARAELRQVLQRDANHAEARRLLAQLDARKGS